MSDMAMIRIGILIAGLLLVAAIFLFGRPKQSPQGRRVDKHEGQLRERREPVISSGPGVEGEAAERGEGIEQSELNLEEHDAAGGNEVGKRPNQEFDKIVSLFVAAKAGQVLRGEDVVVAAEKTGLVFGHMNVFHRLMEGHPERGPIFQHGKHPQAGQFRHGQYPRDADAGHCVLPHAAGADDRAGCLGKKCCPPCSAWPNCWMAWCWTTAATHWAASAWRISATNYAPTTASTRHRR